jgi:lipoate-protein ligase B
VRSAPAVQIDDRLLLLEHDAVLTLGRQADERHVLASPKELGRRGIEVIRVERGGEVTYHGPASCSATRSSGSAIAACSSGRWSTALEAAMIETCAELGVDAFRRDGHPAAGSTAAGRRRKIGALGLRIERGVSYHGIALNIDPTCATSTSSTRAACPACLDLDRRGARPQRGAARRAAVERAGAIFAEAFAARDRAPLRGWRRDRRAVRSSVSRA